MNIEPIVFIENDKVVAKIPVTFSYYGEVELNFDSISDMKEKLQDKEFIAMMELPEDPMYVEDSYEVDFETIEYQTSLLSEEDKKKYLN